MSRLCDYIADRLKTLGCRHVFAIPGDPVCAALSCFTSSNLRIVEGLNELNTAYAVEGYVRINGYGCLVVTDGAGELSALNGVAACFAERLPLLFIVGTFVQCPVDDGSDYRYRSYRQTVHGVSSSLFITCVDATTIDRIEELLLQSVTHRRPVSLHIPHDLQDAIVNFTPGGESMFISEGTPLRGRLFYHADIHEVLRERWRLLAERFKQHVSENKRVICLVGNQVETYNASSFIRRLTKVFPHLRVMHIPRFSGVIGSDDPSFVPTQPITSEEDFIICIGCDDASRVSEILGSLVPSITLNASIINIMGTTTSHIHLPDLLREVVKGHEINLACDPPTDGSDLKVALGDLDERLSIQKLGAGVATMTVQSVWDLGRNVNDLLSFPKKKEASVISQQVFSTIGWALPATIGVMMANETLGIENRPLQCWIGDGAFQMTLQEISTLNSYAKKCECVVEVYVLDNSGDDNIDEIPPVDYRALADYARCRYHRIAYGRDLIIARAQLTVGVNFMHVLLKRTDCLSAEAQAQHDAMRQSIGAPL